MKKVINYFSALLLLPFIVKAQVSFSTDKPKAGETVSFTYNPASGSLSKATFIRAEAMYFAAKSTNTTATPIVLQKEASIWKGSFVVKTSEMVGIMIAFRDSSGKIIDNNEGLGYSLLVHDETAKPTKGAYLGLAMVMSSAVNNPAFRLNRNAMGQVANFEKEFSLNPEMKESIWMSYLFALVQSKKEGYKETTEKELASILSRDKQPQMYELSAIANIYKQIGNKEKAEKYAQIVREKEPNGMFVQTEKMSEIMENKDNDQRIVLFESFERDFPSSMMLPTLIQIMVNSYIEKGDVTKIKDFILRAEGKIRTPKSSFYNTFAWSMAKKDTNLAYAEELSRKSIELQLVEDEKKKPTGGDGSMKSYKDTYGYILEKLGRMDEAYQNYKEAVSSNIEKSSAESNERFILAAIKTGHTEEAKTIGETFIRAGKSTEKMRVAIKELYIKINGKQASEKYIAELELASKAKKKEEILVKMISEVAPTFTLKDLAGKTVSLTDLRGKVVVIDFWATWCGPCIQSFPGMQKAQQHYKDNPNVKFLFIDTMEQGDDYLPKVEKFIADKQYTDFTVPIDIDSKIVATYKVTGIPTKFIIDGAGNIRFKSVGFMGSTEGVIDEVTAMVDVVLSLPAK